MDVKIEMATMADCLAAYSLSCELASGGITGSGSEYRPDYGDYEAVFAQILQDDNQVCFIAKSGDEAVGLACTSIRLSLVEAGSYACIEELVVAQSRRRQGIGQLLVEACQEHAKAKGCVGIVLNTGFQRFEAHRLYEKNGFERVGFKYSKEF